MNRGIYIVAVGVFGNAVAVVVVLVVVAAAATKYNKNDTNDDTKIVNTVPIDSVKYEHDYVYSNGNWNGIMPYHWIGNFLGR